MIYKFSNVNCLSNTFWLYHHEVKNALFQLFTAISFWLLSNGLFFNTVVHENYNQIFDLQCWTEKFFHNNFDWQHARNVQKENSSTNFLFQTHRKWTTSSEGFLIIKGTSSDRQKVLWTFSKKLTKMDILKTLYINVGKYSLDFGRDIRFVKIWPS